MKQCNCCKEHKPDSEFHVTKWPADGLTDSCKICIVTIRQENDAAWRKQSRIYFRLENHD